MICHLVYSMYCYVSGSELCSINLCSCLNLHSSSLIPKPITHQWYLSNLTHIGSIINVGTSQITIEAAISLWLFFVLWWYHMQWKS